MKKILLFLAAGALFYWFWVSKKSSDANPRTLFVSQIVGHPALDRTFAGVISGLSQLGLQENKDYKLVHLNAQGSLTTSMQIAHKASDLDPARDVIVAISTSSTQTMQSVVKKTPIVFASVTDPVEAQILQNSGQVDSNITGVSNFISFDNILPVIKKLLPGVKKIGVVYNPGEVNSVKLVKEMSSVLINNNIDFIEATAMKTSDVPDATRSLVAKVDVIFINNDNVALAAFDSVVDIAKANNIPVITSDVDIVDKGAVLGIGSDQYELGLQVADLTFKLFSGESIKNLPMQWPRKSLVYVNKKAAKLINMTIPQELIDLADEVIE